MKIFRALRFHSWVGCVIFVVSLFLIGEAGAATYYVAPTGNDTNSGSINAPFKTIQKAANIVNPGDTVYVRAGTYNERAFLSRSGTAGNYITFQNYTGESPVMDGTGLGNGIMFYISNASYVKIIGLKIRNHTGAGINAQHSGAGSHLEIRDNEIYNQSYSGIGGTYGHSIQVGPTYQAPLWSNGTWSDVIIDGNYIHDVVTGIPTAYNEALTVFGPTTKFQVTNNIIDNASFISIDIVGRGTKYPTDGIISGNEIKNSGYDLTSAAIYIDFAKNITIENNIIHDNVGHGISVNAEPSGVVTENIIVRRNKVWNNSHNISFGSKDNGLASNIRVVHNTAVNTSATSGYRNYALYCGNGNIAKNNISYMTGMATHHVDMYYPECAGYNYTFDYNAYYPSNKTWRYKASSYTPFSTWQAIGQDTHYIAQDPLFVNIANNDFNLSTDSPYINAGGFLTATASVGSGTTLVVRDARYFTNGYGVIQGDLVQVGSNSPVRVTNVNYSTNTITLSQSISWNANDGVSYPYSGSAPDIGAYEAGSTDTIPPAPPAVIEVK